MAMQEVSNGSRLAYPLPGEEIVISGISGVYPESDNIAELAENLFNKVDLVTDDDRRFTCGNLEIPSRGGRLKHLDRFDALFFDIQNKEAYYMDPMCRMLLEKSYEAIVDAGMHPKNLRDTNCGVFIGACFSEIKSCHGHEMDSRTITGCGLGMFANHISHWLGCTGPSYNIDTACSSSMYAIENAFRAIRDGLCDCAIVGGSNLCLSPYVTLNFYRLGVLSTEGKCRVFDEDVSGYVRSETVSVIFLQKIKNAKRNYGEIVYAKTNCDGYKPEGITYPSGKLQKQLLESFYKECGIEPSSLAYMEAHGTGTKVGDPEEVNAIDSIFTKGRTSPLKIGSIKSNMGHTEAASGICAASKAIIAFESGYIPPNINFSTPRRDIKGLLEGRLSVVADKTPLDGDLIGLNSFGFGGANAHVLLRRNPKEKVNQGIPTDDIPRLVTISGRTLDAVNSILDDLETRPVDGEYVALLNHAHSESMTKHNYRGYALLQKGENVLVDRESKSFSAGERPVWFVFSGIGSQWFGMGATLIQIPVFAAAIERCDKVLRPRGLDILKIITENEPTVFENILYSFVGIAAIQIGLVDILTALDIVPDYIIGHSIGELGCAYADGCLTLEEVILAAYSQGVASNETELIQGAMALIGLGENEIRQLIPSEIDIACHNSADSTMISGPAYVIKKFVGELQSQGIFAKEVNASNIACHSRYIENARLRLRTELRKVITTPKARTAKWISSSVPEDQKNSDLARYCSAEYLENNLTNLVLFEEASRKIHPNAVAIEIAPHGLLQTILSHSLPPTVANIALSQCGGNNINFLFQAIGKLYMQGLQPNLAALYPPIEFPVSRGTPIISPLIKWEHSVEWVVPNFFSKINTEASSGEREVTINVKDLGDFQFITGHVIDGRNLFPATGYLNLVWETIALRRGELQEGVAVCFEDIKFIRATNVPKDADLVMTIMIQRGTGQFEICESGEAVVTGRITCLENSTNEFLALEPLKFSAGEDILPLTTRDIYKELRLRGYNYQNEFKGIVECDITGQIAKIQWNSNWTAFMDNLLQLQIVAEDERGLYVPTSIERLVVDPKKHFDYVRNMCRSKSVYENTLDVVQTIECFYYKKLGVLKAGGIEIRGLQANPIQRRKPLGEAVLERQVFVPYKCPQQLSLTDALRICIQIALDSTPAIKVKTVEIDSGDNEPLASTFQSVLLDLPLIQSEYIIISKRELNVSKEITVEDKNIGSETEAMFAIDFDVTKRADALSSLKQALKKGGSYIISRENLDSNVQILEGYDILAEILTDSEKLVLLRAKIKVASEVVYVKIHQDNKFAWLEDVKSAVKTANPVILYAENDALSGIIGFTNCIRKEPGGDIVRAVYIDDANAPSFDPNLDIYKKQLSKGLPINIYRNGVWGQFRHLQLENNANTLTRLAYVDLLTRGDLSSLAWLEGPEDPNVPYIDVYYSALNFRDIMTATGKLGANVIKKELYGSDCVQGLEYSGRDSQGNRIMGMTPSGALATRVEFNNNSMIWKVPDHWSLEEAATVPVAYGTAYYALIYVGKMVSGQSILIHAGTGGVGQAAIALAIHHNATVFTTVGTPEKREFIKNKFPQIPASHIGNSRDTSFEQMVMRETNGKGVDFVLNSLAEEKLQASLRCLGSGGKFLEIGKFDLSKDNLLGLSLFLKGVTFHGILLDNFFYETYEKKMELMKIIQDGIDSGAVQPLCRTIFAEDEVEQAFRYMAAGKHIGKVLISIKREEPEKIIIPKPRLVPALPKMYCKADRTYVVIGGLGGFGLELTEWLLKRGARKILLSSRNGVVKGYQSLRVRKWRQHGMDIQVCMSDITTVDGCTTLLQQANLMGPVDAIFNLAAVLRDALIDNQTVENFQASFGGKVYGTKNLDALSRKMCPELNHFVVFSSVSCGRGNAGQTNYGMANSIMERICENRVKEGLPALAVQWGAIGEVGLVADMQDNDTLLEIGGTLQQQLSSCLEVLNILLKQKSPVVASMVVAEKKSGSGSGENIVECVVNILGLRDIKTISMHSTLAELGMDSMMAVEIKQTLERDYEVFLTAQDVRTLTFNRLQEIQNVQKSGESNQSTSTTDGFAILVRTLGDEVFTDDILVKIPSLSIGQTDAAPLFFIPGIEGRSTVFNTICSKLSPETYALQLSLDIASDSIEFMAATLYKVITSNLNPSQDFNIIAYSYGTLVALELAVLLEASGYNGRLLFIDGAPSIISALFQYQLATCKTQSEMQSSLLYSIMSMIEPINVEKFKSDLDTIKDWPSKVEFLLSETPQDLSYSQKYLKALCNGTLGRVNALSNYKVNLPRKIDAPLYLVRPELPTVLNAADDYNLSEFSTQPVSVKVLEGNHFTILDNPSLIEIINNSFEFNNNNMKSRNQ